MKFNNSTYHYPPELMSLLIDTIPLLFKSKMDVLIFFKGAGVKQEYLNDIESIVKYNKDIISKYEIVRRILPKLNEENDKELATRREVIKRIVEYDNFSGCYPENILKAKGCVSEVQKIVGAKDSFTRMNIEREKERRANIEKRRLELEVVEKRRKSLESIKQKFYSLFSYSNPQERGRELENVLNDLFSLDGIGIKESFTVSTENVGVYEQIDGAIEIDGSIYLVEMKWRQDKIDVNDVSRHLVRMFTRPEGKGIFISYSDYSDTAIQTCKESLSKALIVLCSIQELVQLLERQDNLKEFFLTKIRSATLEKQPYKQIL